MMQVNAPPHVAPPSRWFLAVASAVVLAALVLRIWSIDAQSLWLDEAYSWEMAHDNFSGLLSRVLVDEHPPLYNLLLWAWTHLVGDSEAALRLPSVLLSTGTIGLVAYLGFRLDGPLAGIAAAVLLACSSFFAVYGQEARMYALLAFVSTLTATTVLRYFWRPSAARLASVVVAGTALLYCHVYGSPLFLGIVAGAAPLAWRDRARILPLLLATGCAVLLFVPWLAVSLGGRIARITQNGFWLPPLSWELANEHLTRLLSGPVPATILIATLAIGTIRYRGPRRYLVFLLCWGLSSVAAAVAVSLLVTPVFYDRYLIGTLPPAAILAGFAFAAILHRAGRAAAVALLLAASAATVFWAAPLPPRHDWRAVAETLHTDIKENDCVLFVVFWATAPLRYYWRDTDTCFLPLDDPKRIDFGGRTPQTLFLVAAHGGNWETALATLDAGYELVDERRYNGIRLFRLTRRN